MLLKKLGSRLEQSTYSWFLPSWSKSILTYIVAGTLLLLLAAVGSAGCFGIVHYRDYMRLKSENASLHQKKTELDKLQLTLMSIRKDEDAIRNFLGLERSSLVDGNLGKGGNSFSDPIQITYPDRSNNELSSSTQQHPGSILDDAKALQGRMTELVEIIREKRQFIDGIPSILPVDAEKYWFSSRFGWRRSPFTDRKEFHGGLDISGKKGTRIIAPAKGRIIEKGNDPLQGHYLRIDHGWGCVTTFAHLLNTVVNLQQGVERGELIAFMGSTGRSTGPHLHYQIEVNGKVVDPFNYIINAKDNPPLDFALQMLAIPQKPRPRN
jgi:murein DD-endopeptidase MepM/ murein hydrolase activator NlpD